MLKINYKNKIYKKKHYNNLKGIFSIFINQHNTLLQT